jgi:methyl-accepting chemotaxis protein
VKQMADEMDSLMAYIEGRSQKSIRNPPPSFTKQSLDELEFGIRNLAESCKNVKESVEEQRQGIENLRDECLRVDAWCIYVQSLAGQATDTRHQELWSRRKLPPDLDVKRKRVIKAEQV